MSAIDGVSASAPPSNLPINPDRFKALLGYYGPYYNTTTLDGKVLVLPDTVHIWSREFWQATGLIRNQSCQRVRITALTAHLLGPSGESLDAVTAIMPIDDLRPGEPVPFMIEAPVLRASVNTVEWQVSYEPSSKRLRDLRLTLFEATQVPDSSRYSLVGSIHNMSTLTATSTRVVAAWLDDRGRLLYIASPQIRLVANPTQLRSSVDLAASDSEQFLYTTDDPALASLLDQSRISLWGISD